MLYQPLRLVQRMAVLYLLSERASLRVVHDDSGACMGVMGSSSSGQGPLSGVKVCILGASDFATDARFRKQTATLTEAGATVLALGVGSSAAPDLLDSAFEVRLLKPSIRQPRLGQEDVWWPLRVAVNLTYTNILTWWHLGRHVFAEEMQLASVATGFGPDIVHAYNIRTLPAAVRVKRATGARIVYDCRDLYTDVEYVSEHTRRRYREAEAQSIVHADAVLAVSEPLAEILQDRYGISRPTIIHNGPAKVMQAPLPIANPVRLFFQGAYRPNRNLASLIGAMKYLQGRATLTMQGFGDMEVRLREQVAALGLEDTVTFLAAADPLEVVESASRFDVGVICYKGDTLNLRSTVPYKLMDYLGAGLAVAASDLPGHRSVLDGSPAGIMIDPSSAESIAEALDSLVAEPRRVEAMKAAALELARTYQWDEQGKRMLGVYESLSSPPGTNHV
ncbi:MAG TPA: glycosyltransferase [Actinobacteria bacterium]|nr:glycosyltransferase [Actinomycetota bacterium]